MRFLDDSFNVTDDRDRTLFATTNGFLPEIPSKRSFWNIERSNDFGGGFQDAFTEIDRLSRTPTSVENT